jgi:YD repeat-containing protein
LGLLLALAAGVPAAAQYEPPKQMTLAPTGVDLTTGRFTYRATDLSIGPLTLERSYVGGHAVDGSSHFGLNWTHNYSIYVVEKDRSSLNGIYVVRGRDTVHFYQNNVLGGYSSDNPDSNGMKLELVNGTFIFTDKTGDVYTFNPSVNAFPPPGNITPTLRNQRIARIDYAGGHTLTFTYVNSQLKQISSNYGYSLVFETRPDGYISKACGYNRAVTPVTSSTTCAGAALAVSYTYGGTWTNLVGVVDVLNQSWGYDYQGTSNVSHLTCVRQVNSTNCSVTNNFAATGGQILQQTRPDGGVWDHYIVRPDPDDPQMPGEPPAHSEGYYYGPEGIAVTAVFGGGLLDSYDANGRITQLKWDGLELNTLTSHEGNALTYSRDARGNVVSETWTAKPGSGVATISRVTQMPDSQSASCTTVSAILCNRPVWRKDYNGNQTSYTYEPQGGVKTATGPAVGGIAPQVRYEYVSRKAWVLSGASYVQEAVPIYLPSRKAFCATGNAQGWGCAIAGDEAVTTYDYGPDTGTGPNNLLLRSETMTAGGVSRRTCYGYDWMGNRISTTRPNGLCQ